MTINYRPRGVCSAHMRVEVEDGVIQFTPNVENGSLTADIQNLPGSILPGTGGMGTTVFYIVGIALVAGAAAIITVRIKKARR